MKLPQSINRLLSKAYLRRNGVEWTGKVPEINMLKPPQFRVYGKLVLGSGVKFLTDLGRTVIQVDPEAKITIGDHTVINGGVWMRSRLLIEIQHCVLIGPGVQMLDSNLHPLHPEDLDEPQPIRLEYNAWIGDYVVVLRGVTIGRHSVLGAGSIATKSIPSKEVWAGNPARYIKSFECPDFWTRVIYD